MKAEIIKRKPLSGRFTQKHFGDQNKPGLYVKFTDNGHNKWIGCFAKADLNGHCQVITDNYGSQCLIVANGKGYLVDIETESVLKEFDEQNHITSALHTSNPSYFVAGTENSIFIINDEGLLKEIYADFVVDGFHMKQQHENSVSGWLDSSINEFENAIDFKIDLSSFNLIVNIENKNVEYC